MVLVNKSNFSVRLTRKKPADSVSPKSTYYPDFKICLVLEGEAVWEIEDRSYRVKQGDIIFLNIGQKRCFTAFGENGVQLCSFVMKRNAFSELQHFLFFLERVKNNENLMENNELSGILQEIYKEWCAHQPQTYELISAKLTEFFIKAERATGFVPKAEMHSAQFLLEAIDYIDAHITDGIDLCTISRRTGVSESTFSRRFAQMNGISFKQYVLEKKIDHAVRLLQTTDLKMIDLAYESGFDSVSGFYSAFKKITGTTPRKFLETL